MSTLRIACLSINQTCKRHDLITNVPTESQKPYRWSTNECAQWNRKHHTNCTSMGQKRVCPVEMSVPIDTGSTYKLHIQEVEMSVPIDTGSTYKLHIDEIETSVPSETGSTLQTVHWWNSGFQTSGQIFPQPLRRLHKLVETNMEVFVFTIDYCERKRQWTLRRLYSEQQINMTLHLMTSFYTGSSLQRV